VPGTPCRPLADDGPLALLWGPVELTVEVTVEGDVGLGFVEIMVRQIEGSYRPVRIEGRPPEGGWLNYESLRRVPFASMVRYGLANRIEYRDLDGRIYTSDRPMAEADPLWSVALTYAVAAAAGEHPTRAVAEALGISHAAAAQRVKRSRDRGYLPPVPKGRTH
jgi:hypothetical protein